MFILKSSSVWADEALLSMVGVLVKLPARPVVEMNGKGPALLEYNLGRTGPVS